jgi:general secretion pathway protein I
MRRTRHGANGFGLLELLVALALVAGAIAAGFQILGAAARGTGDANRYTRAVLLAESRMAELGVIEALQPGEAMGEAGEGYLWRVSIRPLAGYAPPATAPDGGQPMLPLEVNVTIAWGLEAQPQEVTLTTLRLAPRRR